MSGAVCSTEGCAKLCSNDAKSDRNYEEFIAWIRIIGGRLSEAA